MADLDKKNTMKEMMGLSYGDEKVSKELELNDTMSISETPQDDYTRTIMNIGGNE